jgi:mannose-6-phosphate isomerase-like protein (cupin superfamily)
MDIYCVVTGQNESGKSVIISNTPIEPVRLALLPGYEFHRIWGSDSIPELPSDGTAPLQPRYFPPKSGFRFGFFIIPPDTTTSVDQIGTASALEEIQQKLPGMIDVLEPDHPGMHTTDTVDFDVIVSGEVYLELDDGAEVLLKAGECVIQNGTRHAWHNRSSEKCVIAVAIVGAERQTVVHPKQPTRVTPRGV